MRDLVAPAQNRAALRFEGERALATSRKSS
jgi:hypothetical protein